MQALPTVLPPPALPDGTVPTRPAERQANLERFQAELEVRASGPRPGSTARRSKEDA